MSYLLWMATKKTNLTDLVNSDARREQLFMSNKPPRKKTSVTSLVQSTFTLTLAPTREGEPPPQATPLGLPPQQGPEKKEERTAETVMSSGRLNFNSKTGAGSVSSDKAYASISGLTPHAPTGSEWSPSQGSDIDILEFQDVLRDLDQKTV